jgi:hypothetical protein
LALLLIITLVVAPLGARADVPLSCKDKVAINVEVVKRGTEEGNWLPKKDANRVFFVLSECLPAYERLVEAQGRLVSIQARTIQTSSTALALSGDIHEDERVRGDTWKTEALDTRKALAEERDAANSAFRSPVLWFGIGVVAAGVAAIGLAYGLKGAR